MSFQKVFPAIKTSNLYAILLTLQILDLFNVLVIGEFIRKGLLGIPATIHGMIQFLIILLLNGIALIVVRRFTKPRMFYVFVGIVLSSVLFLSVTESPAAAEMAKMETFKMLRMLGAGSQFAALCIIVGVLTKDIFRERHDLSYSLTGATSIFVLIGTIFGVLFAFFAILWPEMILLPDDSNLLQLSLTHSFYVISGQESPIVVNSVIKNLSIFESMFSNLYAVMVVGRLLTK